MKTINQYACGDCDPCLGGRADQCATSNPRLSRPRQTFHIQKMTAAPVEYGKPFRVTRYTGEIEMGMPRAIYEGSYRTLKEARTKIKEMTA